MNHGLYSGVAAMRSAERRLESVTLNLSNAATPGYRAQTSTTQAFSLGTQGHEGLHTGSSTSHVQGDLATSGDPLHLALEGPGFFVVEGPQGELLTRRGDFSLDASGVLVNYQGLPVVFEGSAARIDPLGESIAIDGAGTVRQGTREVGRLRLVDFEEPRALERISGEFFSATPRARERAAGARVHQGSLESSNASAVDQLIELVGVQRSFESASRLMGLIEQSYKSLIERR